jgi:hypothetical protein
VAAGCGVKVTMRMQLAEGRRVAQLLDTVKSGVVRRAVTWMGTVPVLLRVMVWGWAASPTWVVEKVRELAEAVKETSGALFAGAAVCAGAAVPVRSMKTGLLRALLSMTRVPVSDVDCGEEVPVATWLSGV